MLRSRNTGSQLDGRLTLLETVFQMMVLFYALPVMDASFSCSTSLLVLDIVT